MKPSWSIGQPVLIVLGSTCLLGAAADAEPAGSWIAPTVTVGVALLGLAGAYLTERAKAARLARLARIDRQLAEYYGPLLALGSASNRTWQVFRSKYQPNLQFWSENNPPSEAERVAWRLWMETVFMPTNRQIRDIITQKADLMLDDEVPEHLLTICAQVAAYEAILKSWSVGDFSEHKTRIQFPGDQLVAYSSLGFSLLKEEQRRLLGRYRVAPPA